MAKILVVDDARLMRNILRQMFEKAGHNIVGSASNGAEAVEMYSEVSPDLVTMDIQMAGEDGLTSMERILKLDPGARVIIVSALRGEKETEARSRGAAGFLAKPFKVVDLIRQTGLALAR